MLRYVTVSFFHETGQAIYDADCELDSFLFVLINGIILEHYWGDKELRFYEMGYNNNELPIINYNLRHKQMF